MNMNQLRLFAAFIIYNSHIPFILSKGRNLLLGQHIEAMMAHFPPSSAINRNATGHVIGYSGGIFEIFDWVSKRLKFNYTIIPSERNFAGVKINSTWNGMIGSIVRGECDLALGPFAIALERSEAIDFAGFLGGDDASMIVRYPSPEKSSFAALKPFSEEVWIGFLISIILVIVSGSVIAFLHNRQLYRSSMSTKLELAKTTSSLLMYMFRTVTSQGSHYKVNIRPVRILAATWLIAASILIYSYNTVLISYLSVNYKKPLVSTFHDMVLKKHQIVTLKGSIAEIDILSSPLKDLQILAESLKQCPNCRFTNFDDALALVLTGDYVAILPTTISKRILQNYSFPKYEQCQVTLGKDTTTWKPMYFGLPKGRLWSEEISRESLWFHSYGINLYIRRTYGERKDCILNYNSRGYESTTKSSPLTLKQFYFPFILLIFGFSLSTLQFMCEHLSNTYRTRLRLSRQFVY